MGSAHDPGRLHGSATAASATLASPQEPRMPDALACLSAAGAPVAAAAEACDVPPRFGLSPLAVAIRNTARNEHRLWFRPFIDRDARGEPECHRGRERTSGRQRADCLAARGRLLAQQRHAQRDGQHRGASSCLAPLGTRYTDSDCRTFLIDNPWSAAFISWVMVQSGVPGFNASPRHIDYIRAAYQGGPSGVPYRLVDPRPQSPHRATCCASCAIAAPRSATVGWCRHWATVRWATGNHIAK